MKRYTITLNLFVKSVIISLIICSVYELFIRDLKPVRILNLKLLDALYYFHPTGAMRSHIRDCAIISIDDESLANLNMRWPWTRATTAELIRKVSKHKPSVICVDLVFAGKASDETHDAALADALHEAGNVLIASYLGSNKKYVVPDEAIASRARDFGFANKPRDDDGSVRRMRPFIRSRWGKLLDYSLSLKAASMAMNIKPEEMIRKMPLLKDYTAYIDFPPRRMPPLIVPAWKVIREDINKAAFKDKVVFIGVTAELFHDIYETPHGRVSGVGLNLIEALNYLGGKFFTYINPLLYFPAVFLFVFITVMGSFQFSPIKSIFLYAAQIAALFGIFLNLTYRNIMAENVLEPVFLVIGTAVAMNLMRYAKTTVENAQLRKEAITDALTGLFGFRYFELKLKYEFTRSVEDRKNLALLIIDIDHFKTINDRYGHEFGNVVIVAIAKALKSNAKKNDIVARYGGDEFCIIAPDTNGREAMSMAERIREAISGLRLVNDDGEIVRISISGGAASTEKTRFKDQVELTKAADMALYRSKNIRNKVSYFDNTA